MLQNLLGGEHAKKHLRAKYSYGLEYSSTTNRQQNSGLEKLWASDLHSSCTSRSRVTSGLSTR